MKRLALLAFLLAACRAAGEGKDIPEGKVCIAASARSTCAAGLYCDTSRSYLERRGDTYVREGLCAKMKAAGETCHEGGECLPPAVCDLRFDPATGREDGTCR